MMIHTLHGVTDKIEDGQLVTRSYIKRDAFEKYIQQLSRKYTYFSPGNSETDVLTVDDATYAAADACLIARHYGHEVYLFINPWQIIHQECYFFCHLNAIIDNRSINNIRISDTNYNLHTPYGLKKARQAIKKELWELSEPESKSYLQSLSTQLGCIDWYVPAHSQTLTIDDIKHLISQGVKIASHGWSHRLITAVENLQQDIQQSREWIIETFDVDSTLYAVPFGKPSPPEELLEAQNIQCFLSDGIYALGKLSDNCWNRHEITRDVNLYY